MNAKYYEPSGKFSGVAIPVTFIGGSIAGLLVAVLYAYIILYIPLAGTVTFLITGGAAVALGLAVYGLLKVTKVRNTWVAGGIAFLVSLVCLYLAWSTWLFALLHRRDDSADVSWLAITLQPRVVWELMNKVNEVGAWKFKSITPTGGVLWALWCVEAAILVGVPTFIGVGVPADPFCESSNEWLSEEKDVLVGAGTTDEDIKRKADAADYAGLFAPVTDPGHIITLSVWSTKQSELLTIDVKTVATVVKKGKTETTSKTVVSGLVISRAQVDRIRSLASQLKMQNARTEV